MTKVYVSSIAGFTQRAGKGVSSDSDPSQGRALSFRYLTNFVDFRGGGGETPVFF